MAWLNRRLSSLERLVWWMDLLFLELELGSLVLDLPLVFEFECCYMMAVGEDMEGMVVVGNVADN